MFGSSLFRTDEGIGHWGHIVAAGLIVTLSILHLSNIPFLNHKTRRPTYMVTVGVIWFLAGTPIVALLGWWLFGNF